MIKGIIFDFDNTLYDYTNVDHIAMNILLDKIKYQHNISFDEIVSNIKKSNNNALKHNKLLYIKKFLEVNKIHIKYLSEFMKIYNDIFMSNIKLYDGVLELFKYLVSKKIKIGIISNNTFHQQFEKLRYFGLLEYIDEIITSDEAGEEKPNDVIYNIITTRMNLLKHEIIFIGDDLINDVMKPLSMGYFSMHFNLNKEFKILDNFIQFGKFDELQDFLKKLFATHDEYVFLSKYFGQSELNVQGGGGNISIKLQDLLFIKSSGSQIGNAEYVILHNKNFISASTSTSILLSSSSNIMFSMEIFFHSFMKKYTVHLHFTLSNIFLCSNSLNLDNFKYKYLIIEYITPGLLLAQEIFKYYENHDIIFLKNHGIIITADTCDELSIIYEYVFLYFKGTREELLSFDINKYIYKNFNKSLIVKYTNISSEIMKNIIYCFPDLAVFISKIIIVDNLEELKIDNCDILIIKDKVYIISENITKYYSLLEIINQYQILCLSGNKLVPIENLTNLQNMEQEKYRKNK